MGNSYYNFYKRKDEPLNSGFYIFILYLSFIWVSLYTTESSLVQGFEWGYGKLFDYASENFFYEIVILLAMAGISLLSFEIVFWIYRQAISFKIYSFVMPLDRFKADSRLFFAMRNLIYGVFLNICFLFPYLHSFALLFNIVITLSMLFVFTRHIYKNYSEPIISHFVFKTFSVPLFLFEALVVISEVWGWF